MVLTIVTFVIVLGVLVLVHEWGHFIAAKRAGLLVEEFGIGFPPRLFSIKRGETRYSINLIPFGGFVKIFGESGEDESNPRSFASQRIGRRALILAAGILMNLALAYVLLVVVNTAGTRTLVDEATVSSQAQLSDRSVMITFVSPESPAATAGLQPGDEIISIDGATYTEFAPVIDVVTSQSGQELELVLRRGSNERTVSVTPRVAPPEGEGPLGVGLATTALVRYPVYVSLWEAAKQTGNALTQIVVVLVDVVRGLLTTGTVSPDVAGPVGIAVLTGQVRELGLVPLLQFVALLSVNLALINALPIPALDGGRLLFLLIEKIRRRKVSRKVEQWVHTVGFGLLLLLIAAISWRDVVRFSIVERVRDLF